MYGYIYITTNLINNKKYIGKHKCSYHDLNYFGSGKIIKEAINKYGKNNFKNEIIEWCDSLDKLNEREKYWIAYYNAKNDDLYYNISPGGDGYIWNEGLTKDTNDSLMRVSINESETKRRKFESGELVIWNKGKTKETSKSIQKGADALSKAKKGTKWSAKRRQAQPDMTGANNPNYNHKWSDEMKLSQSLKLKGKRPYNAKYVLCVETNIVYNSLSDAEYKTGINRRGISKCCKHLIDTFGGYHWKYYDK